MPAHYVQDRAPTQMQFQSSARWFDADAIIDGRANPLLAAQVPFGRLNGDLREKKLNLLQFATRQNGRAAHVRRRS